MADTYKPGDWVWYTEGYREWQQGEVVRVEKRRVFVLGINRYAVVTVRPSRVRPRAGQVVPSTSTYLHKRED